MEETEIRRIAWGWGVEVGGWMSGVRVIAKKNKERN
jgi:hypothetical protein